MPLQPSDCSLDGSLSASSQEDDRSMVPVVAVMGHKDERALAEAAWMDLRHRAAVRSHRAQMDQDDDIRADHAVLPSASRAIHQWLASPAPTSRPW